MLSLTTVRYNLLIVHTPGAQDISDWLKVQAMIHKRAPDIQVGIVSNLRPNIEAQRWQKTRPSLVFSPFHLVEFRPAGGKVYVGRRYSKMAQYQRFKAARVPTPLTAEFTRGTRLDPDVWGERVILKPATGSFGQGVRLLETREANERCAELLDGNPARLVQQFIDTGPRPFQYRVLTLFGRTLCAMTIHAEPIPDVEEAAFPSGAYRLTSNGARERRFVDDPDVLRLAAGMHGAMPEVPVMGCDILRDAATGSLYALEANPGGNVWHLSSTAGKKAQAVVGMDYYQQFNPLQIVADELIKRTRAEAQL